MDLDYITQLLNKRDKKISSVCIAKFDSQDNSILCIPENRSINRSVAFIPKIFIGLEKADLQKALATTNISYVRA